MPKNEQRELAESIGQLAAGACKASKPSNGHIRRPVWRGPEVDGITNSLLNGFVVCRERFRLRVVDGLRAVSDFNHRIEFGHMWHLCEEVLARSLPTSSRGSKGVDWVRNRSVFATITDYARELCKKYPTAQEYIDHWYNICRMQFPLYVDYWCKQKDVRTRQPLLQEYTFNEPYTLPSGRIVRLRGKMDALDLVGPVKDSAIYLFETKTKGEIIEEQLKRQLTCDQQTMFYLVALELLKKKNLEILSDRKSCDNYQSWAKPIGGVRYNVIRRPLSGGKYSIRQKEAKISKKGKIMQRAETKHEFYERLGECIRNDPSHFFMRWKVEIYESDLETYKTQVLNPLLEQLCQWWDWVSSPAGLENPFAHTSNMNAPYGIHWRLPYGIHSPLLDGGTSELDEYMLTGNTVGLEQSDELFPELA